MVELSLRIENFRPARSREKIIEIGRAKIDERLHAASEQQDQYDDHNEA